MRIPGSSAFALCLLALAGCGTATVPCGQFTFTGSPASNGGISCQVSFSFSPPACQAAACPCNAIAYVQIVRIIDLDTGDYLQPHSEQVNRMVTGNATVAYNGWAVDRVFGRIWGYYGRNDDGSFAKTVALGNNSTPAIMADTPQGWAVNTWFDAVSVPVCIAGPACNNRLLGYEYWAFLVQTSGSGSDPFSETGRQWHQSVVDLAVANWNAAAATLGKQPFPAMTVLP